VDPAGARALARRIAEGKPAADTVPVPQAARTPTPSAKRAGDGVVYIRALAVRTARDVRVYVQGPDGRLRRAR
jgi:hypothetical protein